LVVQLSVFGVDVAPIPSPMAVEIQVGDQALFDEFVGSWCGVNIPKHELGDSEYVSHNSSLSAASSAVSQHSS
jgi:hypothetical protein